MEKEQIIQARKAIGQNIKIQLKEKGFSQAKAAKASGITEEQLINIIKGRSAYTVDSQIKLAVNCGIIFLCSPEIFKLYENGN